MNREGVQGRHEKVSLVSALALGDVVLATVSIEPRVEATAAVELPGKRQQGLERWPRPQTFEHGLAGDMIEGPDRINGQHSCTRVKRCGGVGELVQALGACPGAQAELVREAGLLERGCKVLRQRSGNEAPENVPDNQRPHAAIGLL